MDPWSFLEVPQSLHSRRWLWPLFQPHLLLPSLLQTRSTTCVIFWTRSGFPSSNFVPIVCDQHTCPSLTKIHDIQSLKQCPWVERMHMELSFPAISSQAPPLSSSHSREISFFLLYTAMLLCLCLFIGIVACCLTQQLFLFHFPAKL